ncbi:hypothetical protein MPTK1_6g01300 [Marchantia polymorpha subsp. ruderalis]|uniref:Uncharacterized protein n=2 Tax=Marchantia polymorpha TaxID=3197 RepID=A0AAF6BMC3_MARPO|nr:hypothetical protein MARPO_0052s0074 [Marchantia polymorpha]BBN13157.1 hypothetical protein Mp_6g01300 [Marchantia polymorpha subsp. ruderalis]|eukprot:PTQ38290.1 hypothetical protein MARPO_0052s0074 [Marchantia polymorpha]
MTLVPRTLPRSWTNDQNLGRSGFGKAGRQEGSTRYCTPLNKRRISETRMKSDPCNALHRAVQDRTLFSAGNRTILAIMSSAVGQYHADEIGNGQARPLSAGILSRRLLKVLTIPTDKERGASDFSRI